MNSLKQLTSDPTHITSSISTIIDHILISSPEQVSQHGVIDLGLSDHQLIYCTCKILKEKIYNHKEITFRSLKKKYSTDAYEEALRKVNFPNHEHFSDADKAYLDFIHKITTVIDKISPTKTKRVKGNSKEWSDCEIAQKINLRDKAFKNFKRSRLPNDKEYYKTAQYEVKKLIMKKKKEFFKQKLNENIGKPKELRKTIKSLGLPNKTSVSKVNARKKQDEIKYDPKSRSLGFLLITFQILPKIYCKN